MHRNRGLVTLLLLLAACSKGDDPLGRLIASEPSLVRLERQVEWTMAAAREIGAPPAGPALAQEQDEWRRGLRQCLQAEDPALCVAEAHQERLAALQARFDLDPRRVAVHAAGAAGFAFRAVGNEPGWNLLLSAERATWETDYGQVRHELADLAEESTDSGVVFRTRLDGEDLEIRVEEGPCHDDMSGEEFGWSVVIEHGSRSYRGCADRTRPR